MSSVAPSVVHLIPRNAIGGVESAARSMINNGRLPCAVRIQFIEDSAGPSENNPIAHYQTLRSLLQYKPDVLVCSLWRSVPVAVSYKLLRPKTKLVAFLHSAVTVHWIDCVFSKLMLIGCDAVWADSDATIEARGKTRKPVPRRVISFVTSPCPEVSVTNSLQPRFVFWGRLHLQKGLDRAIEFVRCLKARGIIPNFDIYGPDGGVEALLQQQIAEHDLKNEISLKGPVDPKDIERVASENSFYLQLSREEGMAMSVVEAMQWSLVPVVTPVGEIVHYCRHSENAIVVNDTNKPETAIEAILQILKNEDQYRRLQVAAREQWSEKVLYKDDFCRAVSELFPESKIN